MYAYLMWCIILGITWAILFLHRKDLRYEMIFTTLFFLPFGLTQFLFVPQYWNPQVIHKFLGLFDLESLLFMAFTGGISSVIYQEIFNYRLRKSKQELAWRYHSYIIYSTIILFTILLVLVKLFTTLSVLRTSLLFLLILTPYFLIARKDLLKASLLGALAFTAVYIISLLMIDFSFGGFVSREWTTDGLLGIYLLRIPLEEYLYALFFGMVGSIIFQEIKNVKLVRLRKKSVE